MKYSPQLNVKSAYNFQESLITINDYLEFAKYHNFKFAFYNDVNTMFGAAEFYHKFSEAGIQPIIGLTVEAILDEQISLQLYAKNQAGFKQLSYLSTELNTKQYNDQQRIELAKRALSDDLILVISFDKTFNQKFVDDFCHGFNLENLYFGINQNNAHQINHQKVVYTNLIAYFKVEDQLAYNVFLAMKNNEKIHLEDELTLKDAHYFANDELEKLAISEANLKEIAAKVNFDLFANSTQHLMKFTTPDNMSQEELINELTSKALKKYFHKNNLDVNQFEKYHERLVYELEVIKSMNFINYFLVVWDYVKYAKEQHIVVGPGRGSAGGSLVSFLLGITDVDPIQYNLLFERFLNPERKTMPDIDIDFQDDRRDEVINYLFKKYGTYHVATIATYQTIGVKNALRDVFRVFDKNVETVNKITKLISYEFLFDLNGAVNSSKLLKTYYDNNQQLFDLAMKIIGLPRQVGTHAAGVIISDVDLREVLPIRLGYNEIMQTQFDMNYLETLGLIKMDLLGLRNLSILQEVQRSVFQSTKKQIEFIEIPLDDPAVFVQLNEGKTTGIFQLESEGMTDLVMKMKVNSIDDISVASALFRPGPKEMIPTYLKRKHSNQKVSDYIIDPSLLPILGSTYGIVVYQEQVLEVLQAVANFSLAKADIVRRAMSKKNYEQMESVKEDFIASATSQNNKNHYSLKKAQEIWKWIEDFVGYGFNKAHSIAYAYIGYWLAWFKHYYSEQFYTALFNGVFGNANRTRFLINELASYNIAFTAPDIANINPIYVSYNKRIYAPLTIIKGIGPEVLKKISQAYLANKEVFKEFFPTILLLVEHGFSKANFEALVWSGAFDRYKYQRQDLIENMDNIFNFAEVNSKVNDVDWNRTPILSQTSVVDEKLLYEKEQEFLGFYLSTNPYLKLRKEQKQRVYTLSQIAHKLNSGTAVVSLKRVRPKKDKNGNLMAFVQISDDTEILNATIFNQLYEQIKDKLSGDDITVVASIKVDQFNDQKRAVINRIDQWL